MRISLNFIIIYVFIVIFSMINIVSVNVNKIYANSLGPYLGLGLGYGMQNLSTINQSQVYGGKYYTSPAARLMLGYQFATWFGGELAYTYIFRPANMCVSLDAKNPSCISTSSSIIDLAFTPGYNIPSTLVTPYARFGIAIIAVDGRNSTWIEQATSSNNATFEFGGGIKIDLEEANSIIRLEYINFGNTRTLGANNLLVAPSIISLSASYIF